MLCKKKTIYETIGSIGSDLEATVQKGRVATLESILGNEIADFYHHLSWSFGSTQDEF
jgi:hypothetical protein